jgi:recombination protein RecA
MQAEALHRILHPADPSAPGSAFPAGSSPLSASRAQAALRIRTGAEWEQQARVPRAWSYRACAGRLIELSGTRAAPLLTLAFALVCDAQRAGEPVAWVQGPGTTFFPPDAAHNGVDLKSLVVVRLPEPQNSVAYAPAARGGPPDADRQRGAARYEASPAQQLARSAVRLLRSGAFGLIALDLASLDLASPNGAAGDGAAAGRGAGLSAALLGKLGQLAQRHDSAVCCLTLKRPERPSLGSLVSLRGEALRRRTGEDRFSCVVRVLKDKRSGPGWTHEEVAHGPPGLS